MWSRARERERRCQQRCRRNTENRRTRKQPSQGQAETERERQGERDRGRETGSSRATAGEFAAKQLQGELRSIHVACLPQADQHQLSRFRVAPPTPATSVDSGTDVRFLMYYFGNELAVFNLMNRDGNNNSRRRRRRNLMQRQKMDSHGFVRIPKCVCVCCVCVPMFC